jgi:RNA polymerase sigma factor (sigma-70 family)
MPIEIIVPRLGWSMEEGAFVAWLKNDGDLVRAGEPLFSIEGDKAIQEIEAIDGGILRIAAQGPKPGGAVRVGDVLGHLLGPGETTPESVSASSAQTIPPPLRAATSLVPVTAPAVQEPEQPARAIGIPTISPRALRTAVELGVDWTVIRGSGRSGRIRERDIRAAAGEPSQSRAAMTMRPAVDSSPEPLIRISKMEPTVLITGGCGFIGTWVVRELLNRRVRVVAFDPGGRPARWARVLGAAGLQVPLVQGSILDCELLGRVFEEHEVTHVIHLAALLTPACQQDPWEGCRVNVLGTVALGKLMVPEKLEEAATQMRNAAAGIDLGGLDPAVGAAQEMLKSRISKVLKTLSYREREIIKLRYGLGDGYSYTLEEVGHIFKVTRERIRQIEAKAVRKLQQPSRAQELQGFLD